VRRAAAEAVGELGDPQAVPALIQTLGDSDGEVRRAAAEALGELSDPRAIPALSRALGDSDESVRRDAVRAIGKLGDPQAVPGLIQTLSDRDREARQAAAEALGKLHDPQAVPALIQALSDRNREVRQAAAEALGGHGDLQAIPRLIQALGDVDRGVRRAAARALGELVENVSNAEITRRIARALWRRLTDWKEVREAACQALEQVSDRLVILDIASHPLQDPFMPAQPTRSAAWKQFAWIMLLFMGLGFLDLLKGVLTNLLSDYLGIEWLPSGIAGLILLILGPVSFYILYLLLQNREASQDTQKGQTTR
jgi:HEAT repeat protein